MGAEARQGDRLAITTAQSTHASEGTSLDASDACVGACQSCHLGLAVLRFRSSLQLHSSGLGGMSCAHPLPRLTLCPPFQDRYTDQWVKLLAMRNHRLVTGPFDLFEGFRALFITIPIFLPAPNSTYDW